MYRTTPSSVNRLETDMVVFAHVGRVIRFTMALAH
jgi:hypothetical protein